MRKNLNQSENDVYSSPIWGFDSSRRHFLKKEAGRSLADIGIDDEIGIELTKPKKKKPNKQTNWSSCRLLKRIFLRDNRFVWTRRTRGC